MKLIFLLLVSICLNHDLFSQSSLEVKIKNLNTGTAYLWNTNSTRLDTIEIQNGLLTATYDLDEPTLFYLTVEGFNEFDRPLRLLLSSQETILLFNPLKKAVRSSTWNDLYPNQPEYIRDPNHNELLRQFETDWIVFSDSITSLASGQETDSMLEIRKQLYGDYIQRTEKLLEDHSGKVASAAALYEYLIRNNLVDIEKTIKLYSRLDDSVKFSMIGSKIGYHVNKHVSLGPGNKVPDFEFIDMTGKAFHASDFKGQKLLLHFWSSTCGPCRVENKDVLQLAALNKDVVLVNVSCDVSKEKWTKAVEKDGLGNMLNTCDLKGTNSKMAEMFYIHGIPSYYLIDEDGMIMASGSLAEIRAQIE